MDTFLTHMQMPWSTLIFDNPMLIFSSKMSWTKWSFWRTYGFYITSPHHSSLLIDSYIRRTKKKHRSFFKNRINSVKCPFFLMPLHSHCLSRVIKGGKKSCYHTLSVSPLPWRDGRIKGLLSLFLSLGVIRSFILFCFSFFTSEVRGYRQR